jgi:hypothetical protein
VIGFTVSNAFLRDILVNASPHVEVLLNSGEPLFEIGGMAL